MIAGLSSTLALPGDLDAELVGVYRGWDELERRQHGEAIIDFDLAAPGRSAALGSRAEVLTRIKDLRSAVSSLDGAASEVARARLAASETFLLAKLGVEHLALADYVERTLGIQPTVISENRIREVRRRVENLLAKYLAVEDGTAFSPRGLATFKSKFQTETGDNLKKQFAFFREKWLRELHRQVGPQIDADAIVVEFASEDAYWKNWISGNVAAGEAIRLRINVHERHVWYQGAVETLVIHEYCAHAVQMAMWQRALAARQWPEFMGIVTVHFPDQFQMEGLAESLAYVLPNERTKLEKKSLVVRELHQYTLLVMNNVHIIANADGEEAAVKYAAERLPFTAREVIAKEVNARVHDPLFRCYQYVYGIAKEAFLASLLPLSTKGRWAALRALYSCPMTPGQVHDVWGRWS